MNTNITNSATFIMTDEVTGDKLEVLVETGVYGLQITPKGYGEGSHPIALDFFTNDGEPNNNLNVLVWSDREDEDYTHKISLEGAKDEFGTADTREDNRGEEDSR